MVINWRTRYEAAGILRLFDEGRALDRDNLISVTLVDLGHAGDTTEEMRCQTLEFAAVGPACGDGLRHGGLGVARPRKLPSRQTFKISTDSQ
jgi:hypothetical protein